MNEPREPFDEERLDALVRDLTRDYNRPARGLDEVRRADLFDRIQEQRRTTARTQTPAPRRIGRPIWYAAMAAVLVIGFALGRLSPGTMESSGLVQLEEDPATAQSPLANAYQLATRDYLERTETLLVTLRRAAYAPEANTPWGTSSAEPTVTWANDLLREARLLQDSPAANDDPQLAQLLEDLELLLAQIVQATDGQKGQGGARRRDGPDPSTAADPEVLQRLRTELDRTVLPNEI